MTGMPDTTLIIACAGSYLLGSIPSGLLLGKACGVDVRTEGSGNIGATNLYRTVGRKVGLLTLFCDCLKGVMPVLAVKQLPLPPEYAAWVGLSAFCGHVFSVFLRFRGGKGVATALGVFMALAPLAVAIALGVFLVMVFKWRYISLASITAAAVMPLAISLLGGSGVMLIVTALIAVIVIIKHGENIKRLVAGTENRFKA